MVEKYYKALHNMQSLYANGEHTVVTYVAGEWVEPQPWAKDARLGLWVNRTLEDARRLAGGYGLPVQIWECEIEDPTPVTAVEFGIPFNRIKPSSQFQPSPLYDWLAVCAMRIKITTLVEEIVPEHET